MYVVNLHENGNSHGGTFKNMRPNRQRTCNRPAERRTTSEAINAYQNQAPRTAQSETRRKPNSCATALGNMPPTAASCSMSTEMPHDNVTIEIPHAHDPLPGKNNRTNGYVVQPPKKASAWAFVNKCVANQIDKPRAPTRQPTTKHQYDCNMSTNPT